MDLVAIQEAMRGFQRSIGDGDEEETWNRWSNEGGIWGMEGKGSVGWIWNKTTVRAVRTFYWGGWMAGIEIENLTTKERSKWMTVYLPVLDSMKKEVREGLEAEIWGVLQEEMELNEGEERDREEEEGWEGDDPDMIKEDGVVEWLRTCDAIGGDWNIL